MSLYNLSYFKRHYFEFWGGYDVGWQNNTMFNTRGEGIDDKGFGWYSPWFVDEMISAAGPAALTHINKGYRNLGTVFSYPNFIDKAVGMEFVEKARAAQYAYIKGGDAEEIWILSQMMLTFLINYRHFISPKFFREWQGEKWEKIKDVERTGFRWPKGGPWTKPIWNIFTQFEEQKQDGKSIWDTIFEVAQKTPSELKIPWAVHSAQKSSWGQSDEQFYIEWFNKFFLAYDVDNGGIDMDALKEANWKPTYWMKGIRKTAYTQLGDSALFFAGKGSIDDGSKSSFNNNEQLEYPWTYGSRQRFMTVMGSQVTAVIDSVLSKLNSPTGRQRKRVGKFDTKVISGIEKAYFGIEILIGTSLPSSWNGFGQLERSGQIEGSVVTGFQSAVGGVSSIIQSAVEFTGTDLDGEYKFDGSKIREMSPIELKDIILKLFELEAPWGLDGEPPEQYRKPKTWKQEIVKRVKRLVEYGMWLNTDWEQMSKMNLGWVDDNWINYDKNVMSRVGQFYLSWSDDLSKGWFASTGKKDNGYYARYEYMMPTNKLSRSGQMDDLEDGSASGTEHAIWNRTVDLNGRVLRDTFDDGIAQMRMGGKFPWVYFRGGKIDNDNHSKELDNTGEDQRGDNGTPKNVNFLFSESFINGDNLSPSQLKQEPIGKGQSFFHRIKSSAILARLTTYGAFRQYIDNHFKRVSDRTDTRDKGFYAIHAKSNAKIPSSAYYWGSDFENDDGTRATGQLARTYHAFKSQYKKAIADDTDPSIARDLFFEAVNYISLSMAAQVLCTHRDEIIFALYDEIISETKISSGQESLTLEDIANAGKKAEEQQAEKAREAADAAKEADDEDLTDEDIENRQPFYKQCFLLMNMDTLRDQYRGETRNAVQNASSVNKPTLHQQGSEFGGRMYMIDTDMTDGDKTAVMNRLTSPRGDDVAAFFNARPELISSLVPQIRLFRVKSEKLKKTEVSRLSEIEFDFPKHNNSDQSQYRGDLQGIRDKWEFGIKEFSFSFDGTSPATARNDIKASLTLFFRDFNDLIKKRKLNEFTSYGTKFADQDLNRILNNENNKYSYLDLILFPGSVSENTNKHPMQYDPSEYRIRADVGWVSRVGQQSAAFINLCKNSDTTPEELSAALSKINKSFYLNMIDHDLDFANDGSVTITIEYRAYMESASKSVSLDVLATPEVNSIRNNIQKEMNLMWDKCSPEDMNELIETYKTIETELIKKSYQSIITRLIRRQRMMYVYADADSRKTFKDFGFFSKRPKLYNRAGNEVGSGGTNVSEVSQMKTASENNVTTDTLSFLDGSLEEFKRTSYDSAQNPSGLEVVNFFYVGDLFYTLMDCMYDAPDPRKSGELVGKLKDQVQNTVMLLTSFKYKDPLDVKKDHEINIAEIPVAVDFFLEFMNKNVLEGERRNYPLMYFIRDFCNRLIVDLMNELCIKTINSENRIRFQTVNLIGLPEEEGGDDPISKLKYLDGSAIRNVTQGYKDGHLPFIGSLENRSINEAINYITIYPVASNMVTTDPQNAPRGIRSEDEANGIRHLYIGRPRGLVKTVKFSKVDMQYLREARYFNHGYNGLMQLGSVYKASVEMVGNTLFYPGMTLFINPTSLASDGMDPTQGVGDAGEEPSIANALGIGGYHLVTKVKSVIAPGKFNTTVDARFYYSGDGRSLELQTPKQEEEGSGKTDREEEIEKIGKNTALEESTAACSSIIRIRQKHTGNLFDPLFDQNFADPNGRDPQGIENSISETQNRNRAALRQKKSAEQEAAAKEAYEQRQAAIEKSKSQ